MKLISQTIREYPVISPSVDWQPVLGITYHQIWVPGDVFRLKIAKMMHLGNPWWTMVYDRGCLKPRNLLLGFRSIRRVYIHTYIYIYMYKCTYLYRGFPSHRGTPSSHIFIDNPANKPKSYCGTMVHQWTLLRQSSAKPAGFFRWGQIDQDVVDMKKGVAIIVTNST